MEEKHSKFSKRLGIAAAVVSLTGGTVALWQQAKPAEELPNLTGSWTIEATITDSDAQRYNGDTYAFEISVAQDGARLTGSGIQTTYKGKQASNKWKFEILGGTVDADSVIISYKVYSPDTYTGSLRLGYAHEQARELRGRFTSSVADQLGEAHVVIR